MYKFLTGIMCLIFLYPLHVIASEHNVSAKAQPFDFPTKELAIEFIKKEETLGKCANLTV